MDYKTIVKEVVCKVASIASSNVTWGGSYEPKKPEKLKKKHGWTDTLYHYGVIRGYNTQTDTVSYLDPGAGRFPGFVEEQFVTWDDISKATGGRGYAW